MKLEYVNVRDRKKKWFKGPKNLFNIGKSSRKVRNRERLCSVLGGNFKEPNILFEIERFPRKRVVEIEIVLGSQSSVPWQPSGVFWLVQK